MTPIKKIEIITDSIHMKSVVAELDRIGVTGYSIIREVVGKGDRGQQIHDELTDVFRNSYVMTACDPSLVETVVAAVRPILDRHGGICLVSDAAWVAH